MLHQPRSPAGAHRPVLSELSERSREIFRLVVDAYVETGEPVGSRTLSRLLGASLSPATIRNVMSDLEEMGLLFSPHTSAGRLPTDFGLRLFVDGLMEVGGLTEAERAAIDGKCQSIGKSMPEVLEQATTMLSGLGRCAGLVVAPKTDRPLKHVEFVYLGPGRALVVLVTEGGMVENRLIDIPLGLPASSLMEAGNYLTARLLGRTIGMAQQEVLQELETARAELDELSRKVVEAGLASWATGSKDGALIVRGQSHLLDEVTEVADLERLRSLFAALETKEQLLKLLETADRADGVQIFIGAESELFGLAGCSAVISPYRDSNRQLIGAIGVIGPSRLNYARIIPMVDYTAKVIGRILG
ncbi:MAG TPA: heat-inducible transcriptional repressor HrcA [Dongiaceae bacterium]|nr:heat-inducible transcriptional repressor HrcA [Dongiaceae bacterium]